MASHLLRLAELPSRACAFTQAPRQVCGQLDVDRGRGRHPRRAARGPCNRPHHMQRAGGGGGTAQGIRGGIHTHIRKDERISRAPVGFASPARAKYSSQRNTKHSQSPALAPPPLLSLSTKPVGTISPPSWHRSPWSSGSMRRQDGSRQAIHPVARTQSCSFRWGPSAPLRASDPSSC